MSLSIFTWERSLTKPMARPTKYRKEIPEQVDRYVAECKEKKTIPWLEEIAYIFGIHKETVQAWQKKHEEFSVSCKKLLTQQELALKIVGLKKGGAMAIFLLKANHNYIETERIQHEGKVEVEVVRLHLPPKDKKTAK